MDSTTTVTQPHIVYDWGNFTVSQPFESLFGRGCEWCLNTLHSGICPKVKAIEYHSDGSIKRVEFK